MRFWPRYQRAADILAATQAESAALESKRKAYAQTVQSLSDILTRAASTPTRDEALSIPVIRRARNLMVVPIAGMPIDTFNKKTKREVPKALSDQPDPNYPRVVTMSRTVDDIWFYGAAYWRVTGRDAANYPVSAEHVPYQSVTEANGRHYVNGAEVPASNPLIVFPGVVPGILEGQCGETLNDYLALRAASTVLLESPLPAGWFESTDPELGDPPQDEITEMLNGWLAARKARGIGYVPAGFKFVVPMLKPRDLQLAELRQAAMVEMANLTGVSPDRLGINTTSRVYQNVQDERRDLKDFTMAGFTAPIEQRLSMPDVTPPTQEVRFNWDGFMRTDTLTRAQVHNTMIQAGVYGPEYARMLEDIPAEYVNDVQNKSEEGI